MHSKFSVTHLHPWPSFRLIPFSRGNFCEIKCCAANSPPPPPSSDHKSQFRLVGQSWVDKRWKLNEIDSAAVQETLNQWLSKTQDFFSEVTSPLVKTVKDRKPNPGNILDTEDTDDIFMAEQTVDSATPNGNLSLAAIVSIEQFSR
ncbi:hypothetical protein RHMOL_Rhmol11G0192700 [Rhododendron molle]|nr:hypothetical protein RHMOL_Rhmol11G0192700 [Rhododendron molle]